jgi:TolB-like protein/Tfp pilus assembly protein PilF/predicted Ser/Thr protein kinase
MLAPIGAGGMGEVWKARDTRLGRIVAIKRLNNSPQGERFEQEARAIAALNHPHICQIFDIGPDYLVLEYIDGKPLQGPLTVEEAVRLAIQISSALEEAHGRGILHRDLKPANILVTAKGAKLLDFGLAKFEATPESDLTKTVEGTVMGTASYMAPEQAEGKPHDARSDIFSFGAVLYEMLSGDRAFGGNSMAQVLSAVLRDDPSPLRAPAELQRIVSRCLAKQPADRFSSMRELRVALERISAKPAERQPSIAVLPFANMSADKENEYFSDGLAEEIINVLAHIPGLKVIARTSAFSFRGQQEDVRRIAEALGVANILEGSVRRAGNRVRVAAQLIAAVDGSHLWSERYDREMADVFEIQDDIAQKIAAVLQVKLFAESAVHRRYTPNLPAYEAYLKARYYQEKVTPESLERMKECFEQAVALDPGFASAHTGLASYFLGLASAPSLRPASEVMPLARAQAQLALDIDPSLPEAHAILGFVAGSFDYDWKEAGRQFRLAMACDPVPREVRFWYGVYLQWIGRQRDSVEQLERALQEDPLNVMYRSVLAGSLRASDREEDAVKVYNGALELNEIYWLAFGGLAVSHFSRGMLAEALACAERSYSLAAWSPGAVGLLAGLLVRTGDTGRAEGLLRKLRPGQAFGAPYGFACFHLICGEIDAAADWIEKAIGQRHLMAIYLLRSPLCKDLRSSPRWPALMRKMNLPETV